MKPKEVVAGGGLFLYYNYLWMGFFQTAIPIIINSSPVATPIFFNLSFIFCSGIFTLLYSLK